jgi:septal ring factor EnvC (AmiA/AmiB activator)
MPSTGDLSLLELATENAELRLQLAESQDQCIELAVDAGELHVEITALRVRLAHIEKQRDAWQAEAERRDGRAVA